MPPRTPAALLAAAAAAMVALALLAARAPAGNSPEKPPTPVVLQPSEEDVKKLAEAVAKAENEKSEKLLAQALREMETLRHESFVPAIRAALKASDPEVQSAAIRAAASHELRDIEKDVRKLVRRRTKGKDPAKERSGVTGAVVAAAIDYLTRLGFAGEEQPVLDDHLKVLLGDERRMKASWGRDMVRACVHYLGWTKYKPAVPYFIENMIAQPEPKDVNDPNNPPSSYWEQRFKLWLASEGWVRWALKETTGQDFRTQREWAAWFDQNRKAYK